MDLVKLAVVFAVIIIVLWMKRPLWAAVVAAAFSTVLLYQIPLVTTAGAVWEGAVHPQTIRTLLVFYSITFLQRMMEKRGNLSDSLTAMNGLFNNNRINSSIVPFLFGMLPSPGTVVICGPIVRESTKDSDLTTAEKASVTSYFRHISESFLPTYSSIFVAIALTNGRVSTGGFVAAMVPLVVLLMGIGWFVYLRRVPADTGMVQDRAKGFYWALLGKSLWTIVLAVFLILAVKLEVYTAIWLTILLNVFVSRFSLKELLPFFTSAIEPRSLLNTWFILIFKELLAVTGAIEEIASCFSALPIPTFLIFTLVFFVGTLVAGSQAIIVLCMPMAMETVAPGHSGLALFTLLMSVSYVAMQLSPTHICLGLCCEDYKVSLAELMRKTSPMVFSFMPFVLAYYALLSAFGF